MSQVVIIGGSYTALISAIYVHKHDTSASITIISPTDKFYAAPATPRVAIEIDKFQDAVVPYEKALKNVPYKLIKGLAKSIDPKSNTVLVDNQSVKYDYLIIASGTKSDYNALKVYDSFDETKSAIFELHDDIKAAKRVAVVGGGATGIEFSGEIRGAYPHISVDLYTGLDRPAKFLHPRRSAGAESKLKSVGVKVINNVVVENIASTSIVVNGTTKDYDLVINATGVFPNSLFIPKDLLDERGYLVTDRRFKTKYDNIFGAGDILALTLNSVADIVMSQAAVLSLTVETQIAKKHGKVKLYPEHPKYATIIPITKKMGVAEVKGFPLPSFLATMFKSKDFMIPKIQSYFEQFW